MQKKVNTKGEHEMDQEGGGEAVVAGLGVAWRLLRALRKSPSAVYKMASNPSSVWGTPSASMTCITRSNTSWSESFVNRRMAHRDWIGCRATGKLRLHNHRPIPVPICSVLLFLPFTKTNNTATPLVERQFTRQ